MNLSPYAYLMLVLMSFGYVLYLGTTYMCERYGFLRKSKVVLCAFWFSTALTVIPIVTCSTVSLCFAAAKVIEDTFRKAE